MPTRILLIDDDEVDRMTVRRALAAADLSHELVEASDGASGLRLARAAEYDSVLLDYRLPDVDAFDLLRDLLSPEGGRQAVLMLTGDADPEVAVQLMRAGALDHLAKAELTPSGLARAIRYAQARRGFLGELERARRDAEEKSAALAMLDRQKSLLFSIIAHDLRNPFQALLGLSDVLGKAVTERDHPTIERRARGIQEAAAQAYGLMEGLFAWASLQMDTIAVTLGDVDLEDVAEEVLKGASENAADKGLSLKVDCAGLCVTAHRDMLAACS